MRITDYPILDEIKSEYIQARRDGFCRSQAVDKLCHLYHNEIEYGAEDDGLLFWIGLADAQYSIKELSEEVAYNGLRAIDKIEELGMKITPGDIKRRRVRYSAGPMPERAKVVSSRKFQCEWLKGDTFAYKLSSPEAENAGLEGRYVLFRKVDELEFSDGRVLPIVTMTMWDDQELPRNSIEFQRLPILKLARGRFTLPDKLFEYRIQLLIRSKRDLEKISLFYLGNFQDVSIPDDEVIIRESGYTLMVHLRQLTHDCIIRWKHNNHFC